MDDCFCLNVVSKSLMIFVFYFVPLLLNPKKAESKTYLNYYRPAFKEGALSRSFAYRLETQNNLPKKSANKRKLLHIKSLNKMVQKQIFSLGNLDCGSIEQKDSWPVLIMSNHVLLPLRNNRDH